MIKTYLTHTNGIIIYHT